MLLGVLIGSGAMVGRAATWKVVLASYVGVPFFGLVEVYLLYRLVRRRPSLVADASGLTDSASATVAGRLPWDEIDYVAPYRLSGQLMLGIWPKDVQALLARQGSVRRRLTKVNFSMGAAPANIPQAALPMGVEELAELLRERFGARVEWPQ